MSTRKLEDFVILQDTRELRPLDFPDFPVERVKLKTGDYSARAQGRDFRDVIAIERKSVADLVGCVGQSRARFERELARLAQFPYRALVIESDATMVARGHSHSKLNSRQIMQSLAAWQMRYQLPVTFMPDRAWAAAWVRSSLYHACRYVLAVSSAEDT